MQKSESNHSNLSDLTNPSDLSNICGLSSLSDLVLAILVILWHIYRCLIRTAPLSYICVFILHIFWNCKSTD